MTTPGITASTSREVSRSARRPTVSVSWSQPRGLARGAGRLTGLATVLMRSFWLDRSRGCPAEGVGLGPAGSDGGLLALEVTAGELEEDVVERGRAQREVADDHT